MPASNGDEAGFHELTSKLSTDELIRKLKVRAVPCLTADLCSAFDIHTQASEFMCDEAVAS